MSEQKIPVNIVSVHDEVLLWKKKIHLLEGEKRAIIDEGEREKVKLTEEIRDVKNNIKALKLKIQDSKKPGEVILWYSLNNPSDGLFLKNKPTNEVIDILHSWVQDKLKKHNMIKFEMKSKKRILEELVKGKNKLKSKSQYSTKDEEECRSVENKIQKMGLKLLEAKKVSEKYKNIQSLLVSDEILMTKMIQKVESVLEDEALEFLSVKNVSELAKKSHETVKAALLDMEREIELSREKEDITLEELRRQVEERSILGERIDRSSFYVSSSRPGVSDLDSVSSDDREVDLQQPEAELETVKQIINELVILTGVKDPEHLVVVFEEQVSQFRRLQMMANELIMNNQCRVIVKNDLIKQKQDLIRTQNEDSKPDIGTDLSLENQIRDLEEEKLNYDMQIEKINNTISKVHVLIHNLCSNLEFFYPSVEVDEKKPDRTYSVLDEVELLKAYIYLLKNDLLDVDIEEVQKEMEAIVLPIDEMVSEDRRVEHVNSPVPSPDSLPLNLLKDHDSSESDQDYLTRCDLKIQAQKVVDVKARRKWKSGLNDQK